MKLSTRDLTWIGLFTALHIAAAALLRFGGEVAVPYSLVPLFVMLAGAVLGRKGAWSLLCYTLLGLLGLPVFAKAPFGGVAYILQPSFGFVIGYIAAAYIIGAIVETLPSRSLPGYLLASTVGLVVLYACGLPYLYVILRFVVGKTLSLPQILKIGLYPFITFDLIKGAIAAFLACSLAKRGGANLLRQ